MTIGSGGGGIGSSVSGSGGGGTDWSVPINSSITVDTDNAYDLSATGARLKNVFTHNLHYNYGITNWLDLTSVDESHFASFITADGDLGHGIADLAISTYDLIGTGTNPVGINIYSYKPIFFETAVSNPASSSMTFLTGNSTGTSGDINLQTGTGATRGQVIVDASTLQAKANILPDETLSRSIGDYNIPLLWQNVVGSYFSGNFYDLAANDLSVYYGSLAGGTDSIPGFGNFDFAVRAVYNPPGGDGFDFGLGLESEKPMVICTTQTAAHHTSTLVIQTGNVLGALNNKNSGNLTIQTGDLPSDCTGISGDLVLKIGAAAGGSPGSIFTQGRMVIDGANGGRLQLQVNSGNPSAPNQGEIYYDSGDDTLKYWTGGAWKTITAV